MFDPNVLSRTGTVLLDASRPSSESEWSRCFTSPKRILRADTPSDVPAVLDAMVDAVAAGQYVAGAMAYEAGYAFVDLHDAPEPDGPLAWFGVYDAPTLIAPPDVDAGLQTLDGPASVRDVRFDVPPDDYRAALHTVRNHIREGDVYQINVTGPVRFAASGDPRILYRRLRERQRVPYGAYLNLGDTYVLSCSPELFFRRRGDRLTARPMKGTIRRGRTLDEDRALREQLASDPKNRAENLMIVDLLRNDLSVVCRPGTVEVPALFETEAYDSVTQMTSTVEGHLQPGADLDDILRALFPCGSVTGAPKRRAMRIIRALESEPRGLYCGAIGYAGPGEACFNVAIRTAVLRAAAERNGDDDQARWVGVMGVGSGVVWDSDPDDEYDECQLKAEFLDGVDAPVDASDVRLIETMRFDGLTVPLLDRHVERLTRSAEYLGYPFDPERFRRRIRATVKGRDVERLLMVRATLDRWGRVEVTTRPLERGDGEPWRLVVSDERVDPNDVRLYHKTTRRSVYERAYEAAQEAGADEALLVNTRGEVTEGSRSNLFARFGDRYVTPPIECGVLGGVYRSHVLDTRPDVVEEVLTLDDLRRADALFCSNAARGWCPAVLVETPVAVEE